MFDNEQIKAVTLEKNGIVAAGAGSGKTRVLANRYVWLVTEKNMEPEEILTLTFTNKAVSEMYSRIYRYLLEQAGADTAADAGGEKAASALKNFYMSRISTLDAFSASVARTSAARYGINPDFSSDDAGLRELANEAALRFVLDHREASAIRELLVDHKIRSIAGEIFAKFVTKHSPISSPFEFEKSLARQRELILEAWREKSRQFETITGRIIDELHLLAGSKNGIKFTESLGNILLKGQIPLLPDITSLLEASVTANEDGDLPSVKTREHLKKYFAFYSTLVAVSLPGKCGEVYTEVADCFRVLKGKNGDGLFFALESIANYACNLSLCAGTFRLIKKFQDEFNVKKRATGLLSFNDIARLAVDTLKDHPDIRRVYKESLKMIMIDEFQDNNALQRDLVYLLAENSSRVEKGLPAPGDLEKNRMFFVGDEKQSIYRFRGADVAVFRSLGQTRNLWEHIELNHNYRSRPALIAAFNHIFGKIFPIDSPDVPEYEAVYNGIKSSENSAEGKEPLAYFCFLNADDLAAGDSEGLKSQDLEAVFIAEKIRAMVRNKEKIPERKDERVEWRPCTWSDFAILERSYTHQNSLEKYFREFGIPYNTDRPSGLFNDAPILDLRAFLRLIVYPEDRVAYAALIRSPFMRLSDQSLAVCMLGLNVQGGSREPFAEENETLIPEEDRELYRRAREHYCNV